MRDIKFRFWDNYNKKMLHEHCLESICVKPDLDIANYISLQFTGFKDCNGVEIYEGDRLIDTAFLLENRESLDALSQQVYWDKKLGCWKLDNSFVQDASDGYLLASDLKDYNFKIIGNIYEY